MGVNGISVMNNTCRLLIMRSGKCFLLPLLLLFAFIFMDMKLRQNSPQTKEQDSVNQFYITQPMEVLEGSKTEFRNVMRSRISVQQAVCERKTSGAVQLSRSVYY